jgi:hypothetical protein
MTTVNALSRIGRSAARGHRLVCPCCRGARIGWRGAALTCLGCGTQWPDSQALARAERDDDVGRLP